jgi:hypothetical protein
VVTILQKAPARCSRTSSSCPAKTTQVSRRATTSPAMDGPAMADQETRINHPSGDRIGERPKQAGVERVVTAEKLKKDGTGAIGGGK